MGLARPNAVPGCSLDVPKRLPFGDVPTEQQPPCVAPGQKPGAPTQEAAAQEAMASGPLSAPQREELPSWRPPAPLGPESPEDTCPPLQVCELEGTTRLSLWRCPFQGTVSHIRGLGTTGVGGGREPHPQSISICTGDSWVLQRFQRLDRELQPGRPHPRPRSQLASLHFPAPEGGARGGGVACASLGTSIVKSAFHCPRSAREGTRGFITADCLLSFLTGRS